MTVEEGNKLIAEFMEMDISANIQTEPHYDRFTGEWSEKTSPGTVEDLEYHTSWDWLIPVWGKVASKSQKLAMTEPLAKKHNKMCNDFELAVFQNKPEIGQTIISEFIQWYNTQKLNHE